MLTARYLGPANYGLINYAASIVAFFIPVMQLGLQSTLVQEYVEKPEKEGEILCTSLAMNAVSAIACVVGVISFARIANADENTTILVCALYSTSLLFQSAEMLQYWFQAKLLSQYSSLAMLFSYVIVCVYKIYLLVSEKSVHWFALSYSIEYGITALLLLAAYWKCGTQRFRFSFERAKEMFAKSRHYIAAMIMVVIYNRTGNILLKLFLGEAENGFYATAVTCTYITNFVFLAIIDTARPIVLESLQRSHEIFEKNISRVYSLVIWLSLMQSVFITAFAEIIVMTLYGATYLRAVPTLQILVWNTVFYYMGYVRNIWILAEEKHKRLFTINLSGAIANLVVNICLIPLWGASGAALATVLTQLFANFIMGFVIKDIRPNNRLMLEALNPKLIFEMIPILKKSR